MSFLKILKLAQQFEEKLDEELPSIPPPHRAGKIAPPVDAPHTDVEELLDLGDKWEPKLETDPGVPEKYKDEPIDMDAFDKYIDIINNPLPKEDKLPTINELEMYDFDPSKPFEFETASKIKNEFKTALAKFKR